MDGDPAGIALLDAGNGISPECVRCSSVSRAVDFADGADLRDFQNGELPPGCGRLHLTPDVRAKMRVTEGNVVFVPADLNVLWKSVYFLTSRRFYYRRIRGSRGPEGISLFFFLFPTSLSLPLSTVYQLFDGPVSDCSDERIDFTSLHFR